jgi:argininosuccinate synthase
MDRIVLAYSGGLDTSVAIPWLAEKYRAEIVTVTMDLGQGKELDDARERALALGAVRAHVLDLRTEFARDFVLPALQAGAVYEDRYPLATALGRPLIAKHLVEIARLEGASVVAHGCGTEKGNDAIRIDMAVRALNPDLEVLAPLGVWDVTKQEKVAFAKKRGIPVPAGADSPYTTDVNLWGRSIEYGVLDDPWLEPPDDVYLLTRAPREAPDIPAYVEVEFERGVPVAINGVTLSLVELISSLETIAGAHGVGRIDLLENRLGGTKSREIYEAPAGVLLHAAHNELQKYVTPRELARLASEVGVRYADLVYNGDWYSHTREAMDALVAKVQERVTGAIRLKLYKGDHRVVGRKSPFGLYDQELVSQPAEARPSIELRR